MKREIDKGKLLYTFIVLVISVLVAYFGQPLIHGNQEAINVIVTVFSILAGFLVAVITLVGDPKSLPAGSWQLARLGSDLTYNRLNRHKWLFRGYLLTLFLLFVSIVVKTKYPTTLIFLEYSYLFFASISSILSYRLPSSLMKLQKERIEHEIQERRKREGIKD